MPGKAKLSDVIEALESAGDEHYFWLDRRTGETVFVMDEFADAEEDDDEIAGAPDWQRVADAVSQENPGRGRVFSGLARQVRDS